MIIGIEVVRTLLSGLMVMGTAGAPSDLSMPSTVPSPPAEAQAQLADEVDFGDDDGEWANDGECDDKRFAGPGMTTTVLLEGDIGHDASDCRAAWEAGALSLFEPVTRDLVIDGISFGDDSSEWHHDQQCDDPRFEGEGAAETSVAEDERRDASDCSAAWQAGTITLRGEDDAAEDDGRDAAAITESVTEDGVDFGTDSGDWTNDGECDDPRFTGDGMAGPPLLDSDIRADASDCLAAWRDGTITLAEEEATEAPAENKQRSISNKPGQR